VYILQLYNYGSVYIVVEITPVAELYVIVENRGSDGIFYYIAINCDVRIYCDALN
jgi:hypothetical protein